MSWLHDTIQPILKAKGVVGDYDVAELIEEIAENELYELWTLWLDKDEATWKSKSKKSFILWLKKL
jgi:hypothetical protein